MDEKIIQLRQEFKQRLDRLNDALYAAGLNPLTRIQQLSLLFFLKMLEEQDRSSEMEAEITNRGFKSIFSGKNEKYRWSEWSKKAGNELYKFVRDGVFNFMKTLANGNTSIAKVFNDAKLLIPDEVILKRVIDIIDEIEFSKIDSDIKGDLYEDLLASLGSANKLGQFLTPRHIIRAIVKMVNPKIGETIMDPACGTGGFLLIAFEYIKTINSDPKHIEKFNGTERGPGDKLNKKHWKFLQEETFLGQDFDPDMVRLTLMNFYLHGLHESDVYRKDTIAGSEDEDDLRKFDVILTNPPFAGKIDIQRIKKSLPVHAKKTQVLYLGYVIDALESGGRAGIILPEGTLFGTNKDDKEIRRYLLENTKLEAVVSMPAGVFQPFAGVKTSFLIFKKKSMPKLDEKEKIWFFDMKGDGSSLSAAKKFGSQYRNDLPKLLKLWDIRRSLDEGGRDCSIEKPYSWLTPVKEIAENDYILSANTYSPYNGEEEISHRDPKEILGEIETEKKKLETALDKISKLL